MNKIIEKTYELIDTLESSSLIKELSKAKEQLLANNYVLELINKAKNSSNEELIIIRKELYNNQIYKVYIDKYNELYYIVLDINKRLKQLTNTTNCSK